MRDGHPPRTDADPDRAAHDLRAEHRLNQRFRARVARRSQWQGGLGVRVFDLLKAADDAAVEPATEQRQPTRQLNRAEDDRYPAPGVEAGEHVLRVVGEEARIIDGPNAVDDVERAHHEQQNSSENRTTSAFQVDLHGRQPIKPVLRVRRSGETSCQRCGVAEVAVGDASAPPD